MANTNPNVTSGTEITADLLNSMLPMFKYKSGNTDRASTTVFADDPDLTITLEANSVYFVEMYIAYAGLMPTTTTGGRFKTSWTTPSGATGNRSSIGSAAANSIDATDTNGRFGIHNYTTSVTYGTRNSASNLCLAIETSIVTTTNAGTLALQWAQVASDATASRVGTGSYMRVRKLA